MPSQLYTYDFTIHEGHNPFGLDRDKTIEKLNAWAKKWVFQLERGEKSGRLHFQGRISLHEKEYEEVFVKKVTLKANWSRTTTGIHLGNNFNYVMKEQTRVEGPWDNRMFPEAPVMCREVKEFLTHEMYPWQKQVLEIAETYDARSIHMIWDDIGNVGKSVFVDYLDYKRIAMPLPATITSTEDMMQFVHSMIEQHGEDKCYLVDMPRCTDKEKGRLRPFWAGIECLKNGTVYDKRYAAKRRRMAQRPQIIVFSNELPTFAWLSMDRWHIWKMMPDKSLVAYEWRNNDK